MICINNQIWAASVNKGIMPNLNRFRCLRAFMSHHSESILDGKNKNKLEPIPAVNGKPDI